MKKRTKGLSMPSGQGAALIILITFFLAGAIVGSFFSARMSETAPAPLDAYGSATADGFWADQGPVLIELALLLAVFASAFFRLGIALAPLALGCKGFLLSLLTTSIVKYFGFAGYALSGLVLFLSGFVPVACLLLIGLQSFALAARRVTLGRRSRVYVDRAYYLTGAIGCAAALASVLLYLYLLPVAGRLAASLSAAP